MTTSFRVIQGGLRGLGTVSIEPVDAAPYWFPVYRRCRLWCARRDHQAPGGTQDTGPSAYGSGTASPPLRPLALASSNLAGNALLGTTALMIREYGNTVTCMKATIELPDALVIQAKKRAAELRRPLRSLVESGLRAELRRSRAKRDTRKEPVELDWITVDGGLPPDVDISDRAAMHEWIRRQS